MDTRNPGQRTRDDGAISVGGDFFIHRKDLYVQDERDTDDGSALALLEKEKVSCHNRSKNDRGFNPGFRLD